MGCGSSTQVWGEDPKREPGVIGISSRAHLRIGDGRSFCRAFEGSYIRVQTPPAIEKHAMLSLQAPGPTTPRPGDYDGKKGVNGNGAIPQMCVLLDMFNQPVPDLQPRARPSE